MFGYHQFQTGKHYNAPPHTGYEASIFPYYGYNQNSPYAQPIMIKRARYSKGTINEYPGSENDPTIDAAGYNQTTDNQQLFGGPVPYIYKVNFDNITSKTTCNQSQCLSMNNKDFYVYQYAAGEAANNTNWYNTFCDGSNSGIYFSSNNGGPFGTYNQGVFTRLNLIQRENIADNSTDFILYIDSPAGLGFLGTTTPALFHKRFNPGEKIYALQEGFTLNNVGRVEVSGATPPVYYPFEYISVHSGYRTETCNFENATCRITPYNTGIYDIFNNRDTFANREWYGYGDRHTDSVPTSSGYMNLDLYNISGGPREMYKPSMYRLSVSGVTAKNETQLQVPCSSFFSHNFNLVADYVNSVMSSNSMYRWRDYGYWFNNYNNTNNYGAHYDLGQFNAGNSFGVEANNPRLGNINLTLTSGYMEVHFNSTFSFGQDGIRFRRPVSEQDRVNEFRGTFTDWEIYSAGSSALEYRCNFSGVALSLQSVDTAFHGGKRYLDCAPLCSDYKHPISGIANFNVKIYDHDTNNDGANDDLFGPGVEIYNFDFSNLKVHIRQDDGYYQQHRNSLHYTCNKVVSDFYGYVDIPEQVLDLQCGGGFGNPVVSYKYPLNMVLFNKNEEYVYPYGNMPKNDYNIFKSYPSGCPSQINCSNTFPITGIEAVGRGPIVFDGGSPATGAESGYCMLQNFSIIVLTNSARYTIHTSGTLQFTDFI